MKKFFGNILPNYIAAFALALFVSDLLDGYIPEVFTEAAMFWTLFVLLYPADVWMQKSLKNPDAQTAKLTFARHVFACTFGVSIMTLFRYLVFGI